MKQAILFFIILLFPSSVFTQSITVSDANTCIGEVNNVANLDGNDGEVVTRNIYTGNLQNGVPFRIIWDSGDSRWELQVDNSLPPDGVYETEVFGNTFESSPNPPDLNTGTWSDLLGFCGAPTVFEGSGTQSSLLPVALVSFNAKASIDNVQLFWTTEMEQNNEIFAIEYSSDGKDFDIIGEVNGAGTSFVQHNYTFEHREVKGQNAYYRLKQIDYDGMYFFSEIIIIEIPRQTNKLIIYPNPSYSGLVALGLNSFVENEVQINIRNLQGQQVYSEIRNVKAGLNIIRRDYSLIGRGIFTVEVRNDSQILVNKLIIK